MLKLGNSYTKEERFQRIDEIVQEVNERFENFVQKLKFHLIEGQFSKIRRYNYR